MTDEELKAYATQLILEHAREILGDPLTGHESETS